MAIVNEKQRNSGGAALFLEFQFGRHHDTLQNCSRSHALHWYPESRQPLGLSGRPHDSISRIFTSLFA